MQTSMPALVERIQAEANDIYARMAQLMGDGVPPESADAREQVRAHREHISRYFRKETGTSLREYRKRHGPR